MLSILAVRVIVSVGLAADSSSPAKTVGWRRRIAVAPAAGPTGIAALAELRNAIREDRNAGVEVCAICRDATEERICRQAIGGATVCNGVVSDMCHRTFPALQTSTALWSPGGAASAGCSDALKVSLEGCTTLVILLDELHPVLTDVDNGEQLVTLPVDLLHASAEATQFAMDRCRAESVCLMDAAAAAGVQHVVLHSALGASPRSRDRLQTARMGGAGHLALRWQLETHLEGLERHRSESVRHTILRAAPYASAAQLAARCIEDSEGGMAAGPIFSPPLSSPELLARKAVEAALYTRPNTLRRRVTREIVCQTSARSENERPGRAL